MPAASSTRSTSSISAGSGRRPPSPSARKRPLVARLLGEQAGALVLRGGDARPSGARPGRRRRCPARSPRRRAARPGAARPPARRGRRRPPGARHRPAPPPRGPRRRRAGRRSGPASAACRARRSALSSSADAVSAAAAPRVAAACSASAATCSTTSAQPSSPLSARTPAAAAARRPRPLGRIRRPSRQRRPRPPLSHGRRRPRVRPAAGPDRRGCRPPRRAAARVRPRPPSERCHPRRRRRSAAGDASRISPQRGACAASAAAAWPAASFALLQLPVVRGACAFVRGCGLPRRVGGGGLGFGDRGPQPRRQRRGRGLPGPQRGSGAFLLGVDDPAQPLGLGRRQLVGEHRLDGLPGVHPRLRGVVRDRSGGFSARSASASSARRRADAAPP